MSLRRLNEEDVEALKNLQRAYKASIGEAQPSPAELQCLQSALKEGRILFYGYVCDGKLVAMCSVCRIFSTFDYQPGGVFEDFFIVPEYRHRGIAQELVRFAYAESKVSSMIVGCADCDVALYQKLGFTVGLGNLRAYEA